MSLHSVEDRVALVNGGGDGVYGGAGTSEADYLNADNLFAMRDVEEVLMSADSSAELEVIVSASGKRQMERSKLLCLRSFTLWYSLFPMDFKSVLHYIKDVVKELYMLGLYLGIPKGILDAIEVENRNDVSRIRREVVKGWMSSSPDPPCWWHLVNGLHAARWSALAEEIATEFGKFSIAHSFCCVFKKKIFSRSNVAASHIDFQKKLFDKQNHHLKPDVEFLQSFADVVGSKWLSLASSLSLSGDDVTNVKGEGDTPQDCALKMLMKWSAKEDATYGQLYLILKTIPIVPT